MLLLLTLLFFLLSFEDREAANPVEDGLLSATPVRMLRASGDVIPCPADLPTLPESVIESLDETALGEEDPNEIGGAELVCFALFDFAMPLASLWPHPATLDPIDREHLSRVALLNFGNWVRSSAF